jgi:hypothetical protein
MQLVREGNTVAVIRAWEYIAGKPRERIEISQAPVGPKLDYSKLTTDQLIELRRLMVLASPTEKSEKVVNAEPMKAKP